jgi:nucleoside-diphosphate-sugar epimerase
LIGRIIAPALARQYRVIVADNRPPLQDMQLEYLPLDITDYECVRRNLPEHTDVIVNLTALPPMPAIVDPDRFQRMSDLYIKGAYNLFMAAADLQIDKVVFASTSHVAGHYERNGESVLGREIRIADYPYSSDIYGAMKLCAEQMGHLFAVRSGVSVICLRIGWVVENEREILLQDERSRRTVLSHEDAIEIFRLAIEADLEYGVYYAVSDNPGKPWSTEDLSAALGFRSKRSANRIVDGENSY